MGQHKERMIIISNQAECLICKDKPFSTHVHDYRECKCGKMAVDGGGQYLRRIGDIAQIRDMSITIPENQVKAALKGIKWGKETERNDFGIFCAVLRELRDSGFQFPEPKEGKVNVG